MYENDPIKYPAFKEPVFIDAGKPVLLMFEINICVLEIPLPVKQLIVVEPKGSALKKVQIGDS